MKECAIAIFHGLGDCVNATTVLPKIKAEHPGCKIHWFTAKPYAGIVYKNPYISQVHVFDDKPWKCDARYGEIRAKFKHAIFPAPYYRPPSSDGTLLANYKDILTKGHRTIPRWKTQGYKFVPLMYNTESEKKFVKNWLAKNNCEKYVLMETKYTSSQSFWNDKYTTKVVETLNHKGYKVLLANEFKNFERYGDVLPLDLSYRFMPLFYNHSKGFIGVSSGISCICHTNAAVNNIPHLEFVNGAHWSTKNYAHKTNKIVSYEKSLPKVLRIINSKIK